MKNYLECLELGYLGEPTEQEKKLIEEMNDTLMKIELVCKKYYDEEGDIIGYA